MAGIGLTKVFLTPFVEQKVQEEHERIRAELHAQGPAFDVTSITMRLRRAREAAEAEEAAQKAAEPPKS